MEVILGKSYNKKREELSSDFMLEPDKFRDLYTLFSEAYVKAAENSRTGRKKLTERTGKNSVDSR